MSVSKTYNEDCITAMKKFPDGFFNLALVDPPFGIGNWWMKSKNTYHYGNEKKWNEQRPDKKYFKELFRVSKNQIIWGGNYFTDMLPVTNSWIVWDKLMNNSPNSDCELAWTSFKQKMRVIRVLWSGALKDEKNFVRIHPSQRPIKLYTKTLKLYAEPDWKILDTHAGSQSLRIAAYKMGFDYWGFEIDKDYFDAGNKRFEEYKMQLNLFDYDNSTGIIHK